MLSKCDAKNLFFKYFFCGLAQIQSANLFASSSTWRYGWMPRPRPRPSAASSLCPKLALLSKHTFQRYKMAYAIWHKKCPKIRVHSNLISLPFNRIVSCVIVFVEPFHEQSIKLAYIERITLARHPFHSIGKKMTDKQPDITTITSEQQNEFTVLSCTHRK